MFVFPGSLCLFCRAINLDGEGLTKRKRGTDDEERLLLSHALLVSREGGREGGREGPARRLRS